MNQPSLFDQPDDVGAARARDAGIGTADVNADRAWKNSATEAIRWCATNYPEGFTADEVLMRLAAVGAPLTHNLSALGPRFLQLARAGEIVKTGWNRPSRFAHRHRDLTVWQSAEEKTHVLP